MGACEWSFDPGLMRPIRVNRTRGCDGTLTVVPHHVIETVALSFDRWEGSRFDRVGLKRDRGTSIQARTFSPKAPTFALSTSPRSRLAIIARTHTTTTTAQSTANDDDGQHTR